MGLFNMFGGQNNDKDNADNDSEKIEAYRNIVKLIDTKDVVGERLNRCFNDPKAYFNEYRDNYDDRCMDEDEDNDTIIWIGMVDAFQDNGLLVEMDWKVELEDFVYCIKSIIGDKSLPIEETWFNDEGDITQWAAILNEKWDAAGYVLADMDIDSDSYCVFITDRQSYEKLVTEAESAGHRIDLTQNM